MNNDNVSLSALPRNTARPFYQQIKDAILHNIRSGAWLPGERVPSEHALLAEFGVSRMTVNRALRELTQLGHLKRVHGVGTFVAQPASHASLIELKNIADEIHANGKRHSANVMRLQSVRAGPATARHMQLGRGDQVFHIVLVHHQDQIPIQLEDRFVNPTLVPDFMRVDFSDTTPTKYLMSLFQPDEIEHTVQAVMPIVSVRETLKIPDTEPCLRLVRRTWRKGQVVTYASFLYPSSRYDLVARYTVERFDPISKGVSQ